MTKACIWGAIIYCTATLLTQLAVSIVQGGESIVGLMLFIPWEAVFRLPCTFCHFFGWEWRFSSYNGIASEMVLTALIFNATLGALLGAALRMFWHLAERLFRKNGNT